MNTPQSCYVKLSDVNCSFYSFVSGPLFNSAFTKSTVEELENIEPRVDLDCGGGFGQYFLNYFIFF